MSIRPPWYSACRNDAESPSRSLGFAAPQSAHFLRNIGAAAGEVEQPPRDAPVDFSGNEVRQAIARYKVDPTGALYEEHSPDTEVPRLAPPKG